MIYYCTKGNENNPNLWYSSYEEWFQDNRFDDVKCSKIFIEIVDQQVYVPV